MKRLTTAATALAMLALSATAASANGHWQNGVSFYGSVTITVPSYTYQNHTPHYAPAYKTYSAPAYIPPAYDATDRIRSRIQRQRSRIINASDRGDLRNREEDRLRYGLREIRQTFREYRRNDGVIGRYEDEQLTRMLDRNSRRIARLGNNHRTIYSHNRSYR